MAVLPITVYGDRVLREKAKPVEAINDEIIKDVHNLFETMRNTNSGVGLAGNQIGILKQIFVIDLSGIEEYKDLKPIVMINPEIIKVSDEKCKMEEGCLSLPGIYSEVIRPEAIQVKYLDANENEITLEAEDFLSRVIQHEYDHLIGKLIPDRVSPFTKRKIKGQLMKIMKREVDINYPITKRG